MNIKRAEGRFELRAHIIMYKWIYLLLLGIFLFMAFLSFLTPMAGDDYAYCFSFADWERIESVGEIFPSMAMHRVYANGRVVAHFFAQLFLLLPKMVFNVANGLVAALIFFLLLNYIGWEKPIKTLFLISAGLMMLWYFTPDFGQVYLWLDGACNYAWAIFFTLLFLLPYYLCYSRSVKAGELSFSMGIGAKILFLPVALLAGAYSESASCAMLFLAFIFLVLCRLRFKRLPGWLLLCFFVACVGFLYMMSSPVELSEKAVFSPGQVLFNFNYIVLSFKHYQPALYCIFAALLAWCFIAGADRERILLALIFFAGGFVSAAVFSFSAYFPARALCYITVYTVLGCMLLASALWDKGECRKMLIPTSVLAVLFVMELYLGTYDNLRCFGQARDREAAIAAAKAAGETSVQIEPFTPQTKYCGISGVLDVHPYHGNWVNVNMAKYYGLEMISGTELPTE